MKLEHILIENFKGLRSLQIDLRSGASGPRLLTCLLGDNGSGKTTALQALAITLSLATKRVTRANRFNWHGFLPERVGSLGQTRVVLDVLFDDQEIALTGTLFRQWYDSLAHDWRDSHRITEPSGHRRVQLVFDGAKLSSPQGLKGINQFCGRYYVRQLLKIQTKNRSLFSMLGDVFWFDQHRNLGSAGSSREIESGQAKRSAETWRTGVEQLREFLVGWWGYHTSPIAEGGKDYIAELQGRFADIFPGTKFVGIKPRDATGSNRARDFYFLLERDGVQYDLAEMSSGEQAIFPLLYEFVRLDIVRSIVLIDELELHLHPPQQQALLSALPRIGPNCQFIVTTHSPYLADVIPQEQEVRLRGGRISL